MWSNRMRGVPLAMAEHQRDVLDPDGSFSLLSTGAKERFAHPDQGPGEGPSAENS